jgi:hypothetical protein
MPFLFVLACVAIWMVFRRRRGAAPNALATLRIPLMGAAVGGLSVLPFGYVAQRYLSDFLPLLVLGAAAGLQTVLRWSEDRAAVEAETEAEAKPASRKRLSPRAVWIGLGVLAALSVVVNVALAISYHYTSDWAPQEVSAPFVALQYRLHDALPLGSAPNVHRGPKLPPKPGPRGTVFVVGNCDGIYWSPGPVPELAWGPWQGVARSSAAGEYKLRISFKSTGGRRLIEPIVVRGTPGHEQILAAFVGPGNVVNFAFSTQGHGDFPLSGTTRGFYVGQLEHIMPGKVYDMTAIVDPNNGHVSVVFKGDQAFRLVQFGLTPEQNGALVFPTNVVHIGENPYDHTTEAKFSGTIDQRPVPRPSLCTTLGVG